MVKTMISLMLLIAIPAALFCIYVAGVILLAASRENALPELEDVELQDNAMPKMKMAPSRMSLSA